MKLVHPALEKPVVFGENRINVIVIESQSFFSEIIAEIIRQIEGQEGRFFLSENFEQLPIDKKMEYILDPFSIDFNQKRILNKVYAGLKVRAVGSDFYLNTMGITSRIIEYIEKIAQASEYPLSYSSEIDILSVFKLADIKLETDYKSIVEKITDYMNVICEFIGISFFVFVNLKCFLSEEDLELLYKTVSYRKLNILLLENTIREKHSEQENIYIIDSDLCSIY